MNIVTLEITVSKVVITYLVCSANYANVLTLIEVRIFIIVMMFTWLNLGSGLLLLST